MISTPGSNRTNNHLSSPAEHTPLHIFCNKQSLQKLQALSSELSRNNINHQLQHHPDKYNDVLTLASTAYGRTIVAIYTGDGQLPSTPALKKQLASLIDSDRVKMLSFPGVCQWEGVKSVGRERDVVEAAIAFLSSPQPRRIKLASVSAHSIRKSADNSTSKSINTPSSPYDKVFFQTPAYNDYDGPANSQEYEEVVGLLGEMRGKAQGFEGLKELQNRDIFKGRKRYLVLASTNEKSLRLVEGIRKKGGKNVDVVLLGELRPNAEYLSDVIKLATDNPEQVVRFMSNNGLESPEIRVYLVQKSTAPNRMSQSDLQSNFMRTLRESSDSSSQRTTGMVNRLSIKKPEHHWIVDKDSNNKFITTEIVSPSLPMSHEASSNQDSRSSRSSETINQLQRNSEGRESMSEEGNVRRQSEPQIASEVRAMSPKVYRHYPSNIIPEMSEEYRGSVKESIMNSEPELSFKSTRQQYASNLVPVELVQEENKRAVSGLNVQSEYRYFDRANERRDNDNPYNNAQMVRQTSPTVDRQYVQSANTYNPPSYLTQRVIRKEVTYPEQINSPSQKGTATQSNPTYEPSPSPYPRQYAPTISYTPSNYKAINSSRVSDMIQQPNSRQIYSSPITQVKVNNPTVSTNYTSSGINLDEYQKIESEGRTIYRKKITAQQKPKQMVQSPIRVESKPAGQMYTSPNKPIIQSSKQEIKEVHKELYTALPEQSRLQPQAKPQTIPSVKISAPIQKKPQPKLPQYSLSKDPKKQQKLDPKKPSKKTTTALNESNMFSRMSQLHSDGSILRRNNIRFGVKPPPKKVSQLQPSMSVMQSKLVSGIYKANTQNKKNSLNRVISGEQELEDERIRLQHIITKFNNFHFIIHEELSYLSQIIANHIASSHDRIESFTGVEQLFQCLRPEKVEERYDVGFIFVRREEARFINCNLFPEDYFLVLIQRAQEDVLQIDETSRRISIGRLRNIFLAQKVVIDSKLYQYVAYRNNKREIEQLADKFMNTEFILEKIQTEYTSEIIDFYYCQLPRITRLYLLCDEYQLPQLLKLMAIYEQFNPSFNRESCKLICIIGDILKNDELIMNHPTVTFISNPEEIRSYDDILKYAHHYEEEPPLPIDRVFVHSKHGELQRKLQGRFPGRFSVSSYSKLSDVYLQIDKKGKKGDKNIGKNYLVLHESMSAEKIAVQKFTRVFMVGKVKVLQVQIVRVVNFEELLELMKK